jgi:hypothetical protein
MADLISQRLEIDPTASLLADGGNVLDPSPIFRVLEQVGSQLLLSALETFDL